MLAVMRLDSENTVIDIELIYFGIPSFDMKLKMMKSPADLDFILTVCMDHIHLCVSIPPKMSVSSFMEYLKGKSTLMIYDRHPELQNKWNKAFWARGYCVATIGNLTEEAIKKYIAEQSEESRKEDSEGAAF